MLRYSLLLLPLLLAACGNEQHTGRRAAQPSGAATSYSEQNVSGDFYRRYAGTIANQPVVMQLHRFAGRFTGSYQYTGQGKMIRLSGEESSPERITFTEYPPEATGKNQAQLHLAISGNTLRGEWISAAGDKRFPVTLREDYPQGSSRLRAAHLEDTARLVDDKPAPYATASFHYVLPEAKESGFLGRSLIGLLAARQTPADDVDQVLQAEVASYFGRYRREIRPMLQEDTDPEAYFAFNYSTDKSIEVIYNDDNWVVVRELSGEYTGGAHGNYASGFVNIDVAGARVWNLGDIVRDSTALRPLLNDAAINYFGLKPGSGMENRLLVDEVPVTDNIFLSGSGIAFVYNPYEIASYADGEILLFLPYSRISNLLTESFRARMRIGSRAGVAQLTSEPHSFKHANSRPRATPLPHRPV